MPVVAAILAARQVASVLDAPSGSGWLRGMLDAKIAIDGIDLYDARPGGYRDFRAANLDRGLPGLAELCGGVAFLEAFTREDRAVGDEHDFQQRPASFYRRRFAALGFAQLGSHCWLSPALRERATALEIPG